MLLCIRNNFIELKRNRLDGDAQPMIEPGDIQQALQRALQCHGTGDLGQAEQIYRHILGVNSQHPDALHYLGVIGLQKGRFEDAAELIGKAIEFRPEYLDALANLGNVMQALGRYDEAVARYRQALELQPNSAATIVNLANALLQLGQPLAAIENYEAALAIEPGLVDARRSLADALLAQGRPSEALRQITLAAGKEPKAPEMLVSMGNILQELGRSDEAIACFETVLNALPEFTPVYCNLGNVLRQQGRLSEAIEFYEKALGLDPNYVEGYYDLGVARQELGDQEKALSSFRRAITLDRHFTKAWHAIASQSRSNLNDEDVQTMQQALRSSSAYSPEQRMHLEFALGKVQEGDGNHRAAIEHYHTANRIHRAAVDYSVERDETAFDNLKAILDSAFLDRWSQVGVADTTPIFIIGMPRSGTTLAEQIIASHASVFGAGELLTLPRVIDERFPMLGGVDYTAALETASASDFQSVASRYISSIRKLDSEARHITDKLPTNFLNFGLIKILFPKARVIHCVRDARDTCYSIYKHFFSARGHHYAYDMEDLGHYYNRYADLMAHWRQIFPEGLFDLHYESMVGDQETTTRTLLDACGLPWDPACLKFHKTTRPVATISAAQVRQPIYTGSVGAWRNYEESLAPLLRILGKE